MEPTLSAKQIRAASLIAAGKTKKETAEAVGVKPQSISQWLHNPSFEALINRLKWSGLIAAQDRMRGLANSAVNTLAELATKSKSERIRLEAAKYILETVGICPGPEAGLWPIDSITEQEVAKETRERGYPKVAGFVEGFF